MKHLITVTLLFCLLSTTCAGYVRSVNCFLSHMDVTLDQDSSLFTYGGDSAAFSVFLDLQGNICKFSFCTQSNQNASLMQNSCPNATFTFNFHQCNLNLTPIYGQHGALLNYYINVPFIAYKNFTFAGTHYTNWGYTFSAYCFFPPPATTTAMTSNSSTTAISTPQKITTTEIAPSNYCNRPNGHLICSCDPGYTGNYCNIEIDWCQMRVSGVHYNTTINGLCSLHGTCINRASGAQCLCSHGFKGKLCQTTIDGQEIASQRCALYSTNETEARNLTVSCPRGQRCLTDNLDCAFGRHCDFPVGWCLPQPEKVKFSPDFTNFSSTEKLLEYESNSSVPSSNHSQDCNGHGAPACHCSFGYTGSFCDTEIDFCNQTLDMGSENIKLWTICANGHCHSTTAGGVCICNPGFTGTFCDIPVAGEAFCGLRCALYSPPMTALQQASASNLTAACTLDQRCISDNLDCAFNHCDNPDGWCLPYQNH